MDNPNWLRDLFINECKSVLTKPSAGSITMISDTSTGDVYSLSMVDEKLTVTKIEPETNDN